MRIEYVTVDDDLAVSVDALWPEHTWSEVIEHALALLVHSATDVHEDTPADVGAGLTDLDARIAQALR